MRRRLILSLSATAAVLCILMPAGAAQADSSSGCGAADLSQPFLPWGDPGYYGPLPNGGFERQASSWSLDGGAQVVSGNEPFYVHRDSDSRALSLGDSGSATSDPVCVNLQSPTLRLFAQNSGSPLSSLAVSVQFTDVLGQPQTLPVALINSGSDWQPTTQIPVVVNMLSLPLLSDGSADVSFQLTPVGPGGDWTIDDVYLDPFKTS